jgi:hypothetical protein
VDARDAARGIDGVLDIAVGVVGEGADERGCDHRVGVGRARLVDGRRGAAGLEARGVGAVLGGADGAEGAVVPEGGVGGDRRVGRETDAVERAEVGVVGVVGAQARGREVGDARACDVARVAFFDDDIVVDLGGLGGGVEDGGVVAARAGGRGRRGGR